MVRPAAAEIIWADSSSVSDSGPVGAYALPTCRPGSARVAAATGTRITGETRYTPVTPWRAPSNVAGLFQSKWMSAPRRAAVRTLTPRPDNLLATREPVLPVAPRTRI